MANKRQRKKQQQKQNINKLRIIGFEEKEIKQIKNNTVIVEKVFKKENRNLIARQRSKLIKDLGYKVKEHGPKRYWKEDRFNSWYQDELNKKKLLEEKERKKREKKEKDLNDYYLLIFWRDKTAEGYADAGLIERFKRQYKYLDNETLLTYINYYLRTPKPEGAEIGTTSIMVLKGSQRKQYINFMSNISQHSNALADSNDWVLVYEGKARRYHDLLVSIHAVIRLLYDASERASFVTDLLTRKLPQVNKNMAIRLIKDLEWRGF